MRGFFDQLKEDIPELGLLTASSGVRAFNHVFAQLDVDNSGELDQQGVYCAGLIILFLISDYSVNFVVSN